MVPFKAILAWSRAPIFNFRHSTLQPRQQCQAVRFCLTSRAAMEVSFERSLFAARPSSSGTDQSIYRSLLKRT